MNYRNLFSSLLIVLSLIFSGTVIAQTATTTDTLDNCFDYYKFQSVQVSVGTENGVYKAGDVMSFSGELINENTYPVVDGNVFVRISEVNPNYTTEGHYTVGEFIAKENIAIDASSSQLISFQWKTPANLKDGSYRADYFFSVGKQFNLGGLPFTNEIIVGFSNFSMESAEDSSVYLDRAGTKVNGTKYNQIGNWPIVEAGSKVAISQVLKNTTDTSQTVSVSYNLYFWDSLNPSDLISSKAETVTIASGKDKTLTYEIPKVDKSVYYLKITAKTSGGAQSILNIRLSSEMERPRINYFAVTGFPLKKGESAKIFSCFHNTSNIATEGKVVLSAKDIKGNEIAKIQYNGIISSAVSAKAGDLKALKNLTYLKLDQLLYDKSGKVIEQKSEIYDCKTLDSAKCVEMTKFNFFVPIAIVAGLFLILSLIFIKKNKSLSLIFLAIAIIFAVVGAMMRYTGSVSAETTSENGKTKTQTLSERYGWYKGGDLSREAVSGDLNAVHSVTLSGDWDLILDPGQTINFTRETDCSFNSTGGIWDTPYCGSAQPFTDVNSGKTGSIRLGHSGFSMSLTSADNNKLSCSGTTCTAGNTSGTVNVRANITSSAPVVDGWVNTDAGSTCEDASYTGSACSGSFVSTHKMILYEKNTTNAVVIPAYQTSVWTITIRPVLTASCSASPASINTGGSSTWTASAGGGTGSYTYLWTGTDSLTGTTTSVIKTYSTAGTKTASVTVTSGGQTSTVNCTNSVTVNGQSCTSNGFQCGDCIDNDSDTKIDHPTDPGCASLTDTTESDGGGPGGCTSNGFQCGDCIDNDSDTKIDHPTDPGCTSLTDTTEADGSGILPPECGSLASTTPYISWPSSPRDYCSVGVLYPGDEPELPDFGLLSWDCYVAGATGVNPRTCSAEKLGPVVLGSGNCTVSQADPKPADADTIYSNKTATLESTASYGSDYTFTWKDMTKAKTIGTGKVLPTIFTTVGNREIKLFITKTGDVGATCTTSVKVIQKPTDVIEQ